jgi:hypothetical protein
MIVAPGYFRLMRIPLLDGRDFTEQDDSKAQPVLIATAAFAKRYFDGRDPIGRKVRLSGLRGGAWFTVVGLVRDSMLIHPGESPLPSFYVPFEQMFFRVQQLCLHPRRGRPELHPQGDPAGNRGARPGHRDL